MLLLPSELLGTILIWRWLLRLRGPGLVLLGIADNSAVPLTGSMDVLTIWLAASDRRLWPYYALMATVGAVLGGYITYALARKGGKQAIALKLGEMVTRARAARLLTLDAAAAFDRGERCDMEAGMAKYFATEAGQENALEAMRIFGGYGYSKEYNIERLYRDAPLLLIGEGTNELQRMIIAKQLIERNKA